MIALGREPGGGLVVMPGGRARRSYWRRPGTNVPALKRSKAGAVSFEVVETEATEGEASDAPVK
jgi:hypothetical protein